MTPAAKQMREANAFTVQALHRQADRLAFSADPAFNIAPDQAEVIAPTDDRAADFFGTEEPKP